MEENTITIDNPQGLNPCFATRSAVLYEKRPVDELRWINTGTDEEPAWRYVSDVQILLNEKRLVQQIGVDNYRALIAGMTPSRSPYENGKFSDEELFRDIKSRYLQSASEIRAYMDSLMSTLDSEVDKAKATKEMEEIQARNNELQTAVENFYKKAGAVDPVSTE